MLGLHGGSVVSADALVALLWGDDPPRTATKALQTHISSLRRALGDGFVLTEGTGWTLSTTEIDAIRYKTAAKLGRRALTAGDPTRAVALFDQALALWRGIPELPDSSRGSSEKTRWLEGHAALVEDRADALLATGRAAEIVGELESAIAEAPLRERRWGHLMLALYRAGRQGEALGAYKRARSLLAEELGVDPGPELRRLEAAIVAQDASLEVPQSQQLTTVTRAVTFLLTDIEGSTAAWESDADAMATALARHDEMVEQVVTSRGGRLIKTRGEGDATFSVFDRPSAAAAAAIELQEAIAHEAWQLTDPMRIRVALHTGEVEFRDGDYFGRAVNRAARLRSLATGGQILCSGATAELVIDSLPDDVVLADLGTRRLRNLPRPEHVFELRMEAADEPAPSAAEAPMERPALPAVLVGPGPFVGRGRELERLVTAWQSTLAAGTRAVLIAGEPGVGKTRLAGEWSRHAYDQGAVVLYGRCDEDLGAPYQPFAEALRALVSCVDSNRLRNVRGVEALLPLVPGLADALPDVAAPPRADPDTERYALFDAVVALLGAASATAPVVLIVDDLHWAAKPTLLLLRHLLRFGEEARVQIVGTYRSTDLDRSHPLAAMLADLHRDGTATRLQLSGLDEGDVTAYVAEAGYDDEELGRALAAVTGGNPFFLIEALRHVEESGGRWDPSTLPQGVREAVSRRLSRLTAETNKALAAAAVVGSRFPVTLVEQVVGEDLVDAFDEAGKAGIVIEEPGGRYRFNHALVRQSLLAELPSVRRMRLHQRIAVTLEAEPGADDELLAELAHHYFECAWAGNAAKAVEYCRRAADQAMSRVAYEGAADLYDRALHALEELDDELPDRDELQSKLLIAHCEALLAAGDVTSAKVAVSQLREVAGDSGRLGAWGVCFDGELSMLTDPERLDQIESAVSVAAEQLAALEDAAGEAKAHTVRAGCLARLGRIGDCETALDQALTAARRAHEHSRVNAVLAGAPLAALWGPNPVPRAGGRCLDVVRLLRITTGSPLVEATSTRCQAVLDAFRGRAAEGRRLIESARRTLTELGLRHALLEVDQFAGIIELVADDAAAAEPYLRRAYEGFRRMGLDTDTADTAALLARACLALDRDSEADELCSVSERLAGHGSKASIAWRSVRAQLLARADAHDRAKEVAEEAVSRAAATDALVDHGDACLALATVLRSAGNTAGMRAAAEQAVTLYERKGAAALTEKARKVLGSREKTAARVTQVAETEPENSCVRVVRQLAAAADRGAWDEYQSLYAPAVSVESRRKMVGFTKDDLGSGDWPGLVRRVADANTVRHGHSVVAVRGERLALCRLTIGGAEVGADAPHEDVLELYALDDEGRIARRVWFDADDADAAVAELDVLYAQVEKRQGRWPLENSATRAVGRTCELFAAREWGEIARLFAGNVRVDDRRRGLHRVSDDRATEVANIRELAALGVAQVSATPLALRGDRLVLSHLLFQGRDTRPEAFATETLALTEVDSDGLIVAMIGFDRDDFDAAIAELDARYEAGEAAAYAQTWSIVTQLTEAFNRHDFSAVNCPSTDHRRLTRYAPGDLTPATLTQREFTPDLRTYIETVHRLSDRGVVIASRSYGIAQGGFEAEWRVIIILLIEDEQLKRYELFDETDVDAALARFDQLSSPTTRPENAANRIHQRMAAHFANRDWDATSELMAEDITVDDRRRVVNTQVRVGREATIESMKAGAELGARSISSVVLATRGDRLALLRTRHSGEGSEAEALYTEDLSIVEIDADGRICAGVILDLDDFGSAIAELETRYVAGEAAPFARTWTVISQAYAGLNRNELAPTTPDWVNVDRRRLAPVSAGRIGAYIRESQQETPGVDIHIEAVHRLSELGAVVTRAVTGASREGFYAERREVDLITVDGELVSRCEIFDEADLDVALTEFEQLDRRWPQLQNAASRTAERFRTYFVERDWDTLRAILTEKGVVEDRRQVISAPLLRGLGDQNANLHAMADLGITIVSSQVIALRGERLALGHTRYSVTDDYYTDVLDLVEVDTDGRFLAYVGFDPDDVDAAFEELEARYMAGEAAIHAQTWSVIAGIFASLARHEVPASTPDWLNIDHRRGTPLANADLRAIVETIWDITPDLQSHIEIVHRLGDRGALCTQVSHGTTPDGFPAEWRMLNLTTVDGALASGCELFDETDLEAAIARFEELGRPERQLENAASRAGEKFLAHFAADDWDAISDSFAETYLLDDRRRIVSSGVRRGRAHAIEDVRAVVDVGLWAKLSLNTVATRGGRLALMHLHAAGPDPGASQSDLLQLAEIDDDGRFAAVVVFDVDDIDAAFDELEHRYLAGEASPHAHAWSIIAGAYAAVLRHEMPPTTPDWVNVDHRRVTSFAPNELGPFLKATWDVLESDVKIYVENVHRLTDTGAVVTRVIRGTSREGFAAEWREIGLSTVDGDRINRSELFDETDLDAALARFDELNRSTTHLDNAASRLIDRYCAAFVARDWTALAETLAEDVITDDRRRVVNGGLRRGRDMQVADSRAAAEVGSGQDVSAAVLATRGDRLVLSRIHTATQKASPGRVSAQMLGVAEIDADNRITLMMAFDDDDLDTAFRELDARYLAGEAADYAQTWSAIVESFAAVNRGVVPEVAPGCINLDHRRAVAFAPGELGSYTVAAQTSTPDFKTYVEAVHRLDVRGAVVSYVAKGTSAQGFQAEWRGVSLSTVGGGLVDRVELFDEPDLEVALAQFDEITRPVARPVNAAYRMVERLWSSFAKRDWAAIGELLAPDIRAEDRRRIVNDGLRQGREAFVANMRAVAEVGIDDVTSTVVATRGQRLVLARVRTARFHSDVLNLVELDAQQRVITSTVVFDVEDLDAAFTELDAQYGAGEGAAHGRMWTVLANAIAAFNRRALPPTTPDWVNIDHRSGTSLAPGQLFPYVRTSWELAPDISNYIEVVHGLNDSGAVFTRVASGTSQEGFNAEWRVITLATFDGDLLSRVELFDETDLDAALVRFEELNPPAPVSTNAATKLDQRPITGPENAAARALAELWERFDAQDWDAIQGAMIEDFASYDRRQVVNAGVRRGRTIHIENMRSVGEVGFRNAGSPAIATRGEHLALCRSRFTAGEGTRSEIVAEALMIIETDAANRLVSNTVFDLDSLREALADLDAKYAAGEASPHARTWSVVTRAYDALNRHEQFERDWIYTDHRRGTPFGSTPSAASAHPDVWDVTPDLNAHIEVVHRLTDGAVLVTSVVGGSSQDGFEAEWRFVQLLTVTRGSIERCELFDETDIDTALARFDELRTSPTHLDNAAVRLRARVADAYNRRDTETFAAGAVGRYEDRRRGLRDAGITDAKYVLAVLSETPASWTLSIEPVAIRGDRLALTRETFRDTDDLTLPITVELIVLTDVADDEADLHTIFFDPDAADAAFEELDRRFAAGEAASYSRTWSAIAESYAMANRRETPSTTPAWVDHRLVATIEAADLIANLRAAWEIAPDIRFRIATVHRLTKLGAVIDHMVEGHSDKGFPFDYRELALVTVDGDRTDRFEMFDADSLDAAFARLDELNQAPPIGNSATRFWTVVVDAFNRRDVETVLNLLSDDGCQDDRRSGLRGSFKGSERRRAVEAMFTTAPASWRIEVEPIAVRGSLLALVRQRYRDSDSNDHQVVIEVLSVTEMLDNKVVHHTVDFDPADILGAFEELESRYVAGEAAPYAHTWSLVIRTYDAFNRHELSPTTEGWVNIDHRPVIASAPGGVHEYVRESWEVASDISTRIEAVHRLSGIGAVFTHAESGTSREGFAAEWREVTLLTFEGDAITRCEIFDEDDLDTALARFDELSRRATHIENAATRMWVRLADTFNHHDVEGFLGLTSPHGRIDDRRKGLQALHEPSDRRKAALALFESPLTWRTDLEPVATRGERLALARQIYRDTADESQPVTVEVLTVVEINDDGLMGDFVNFDSDDLDGALAELDARYLAREAAPHARTWSAIADGYVTFNRRELFKTTPDWVNIDHRRGGTAFAPGEQISLVNATWDVVPKIHAYAEVVHRLGDLGAVVTQVVTATSREGFDGEWREVVLLIIDGDAISRCEVFDEGEIDAALARFDELDRPAHRLANAATRVRAHLVDAFGRRDLDAFRSYITENGQYDDRRKGLRNSGSLEQEFVPTMLSAAPESWQWTDEPIAIRGERLALCRDWFRDTDAPGHPVTVDDLSLTEITEDGLVCHSVIFDSDDLDAAMRELDARWIESGEVEHPEIIDAHRRNLEMTNRHDWDALTAVCSGATYINHRQLGSDTADYIASISTLASLAPDLRIESAEIMAHSAIGVATHVVVKGTSTAGLAIEVPFLLINLWAGDHVTHIEAFDPDDSIHALERFEQLNASD
ncbi:BTAD domain-containing putative transcriptional regulator [Mycolicibacterium celeriflavum]|uniref:BTAD domain-containing putative transcriptional regulator n=1 Tax=Mycolicibacterium celeriflavum TaxID=1249101 RepID=UPI003CEC7374